MSIPTLYKLFIWEYMNFNSIVLPNNSDFLSVSSNFSRLFNNFKIPNTYTNIKHDYIEFSSEFESIKIRSFFDYLCFDFDCIFRASKSRFWNGKASWTFTSFGNRLIVRIYLMTILVRKDTKFMVVDAS